MSDTTDRQYPAAPDLYAMFDIPRRRATDATNITPVIIVTDMTERRFHASRALQGLPAVLTIEALYRAGFRGYAIRPTTFGSGSGWR